jgi:ABC-type branched-subunit amino acid transport system ATPase component
VPQGGALFTGMTVADNLALGRFERQTGAGVHWDEDRIFWFFPRLRNRLNARVSDLSRDERRIVALARALAGDVRVLLIDEPFEALSPAATEDMFEALDKLRYDVAVVVADNRPDLVLALADRALVLENGAAIWRGAASRLRDDPELRQKMLWAR